MADEKRDDDPIREAIRAKRGEVYIRPQPTPERDGAAEQFDSWFRDQRRQRRRDLERRGDEHEAEAARNRDEQD